MHGRNDFIIQAPVRLLLGGDGKILIYARCEVFLAIEAAA